mmetsp:Transcript_25568/g.38609  ORF Transcript_25568/g.38609 Transcript_25568/m.38609 type:complete len:229 (-) Transcript_25568:112-798(-)
MVHIDKLDKPQSFRELYQHANPLPGRSAKVPLLELVEDEHEDNSIVLCESLIISEFVAEHFVNPSNTDIALLPLAAKDRAMLRLFLELCGSNFAYLRLLRAKNMQEFEQERIKLEDGLVEMDTFLSSSRLDSGPFLFGDQFSLAECNIAPFLQRCCAILQDLTEPDYYLPVHPLSICANRRLVYLEKWIRAVLERPSVENTRPPDAEMSKKRLQLQKRLARLRQQENE